MSDQLHSLAARLEEVLLPSNHGGFTWFGVEYAQLEPDVWDAMAPVARRSYTEAALSGHLYGHLYCHGRFVPDMAELAFRADGGSISPQLAEANQVPPILARDWNLSGLDTDRVTASKHGITVEVPAANLVEDEHGAALAIPSGEPSLSPGFYLVVGEQDVNLEVPLYRFYFSLTPPGRVAAMRLLTTELTKANIAFRFKALSRLGVADRADSAVLYVDQHNLDPAVGVVKGAVGRLQPWAIATTPTFSQSLTTWIGYAQDPGDGESFGSHRCAAVAAGWADWVDAAGPPGDLMRCIVSSFTGRDIDPERPHLRTGGVDVQQFGDQQPASSRMPNSTKARSHGPALLDVAVGVGKTLLDSAIRSDSGCQWMITTPGTPDGQLASTMNASVYDGLSGVALFLAELAIETGEEAYADAARSAMTGALDMVAGSPTDTAGIFSGAVGVVVAAHRVSSLLDTPESQHRAQTIAEELPVTTAEEPDALLGSAGEVFGWLNLARLIPDERFARRAVDQALELCCRTTTLGDGLAWLVSSEDPPRPLAGFTHGASGIVAALLNAAPHADSETAETLLETARRGLVGEDTFFRSEAVNWLDVRGGRGAQRFSYYWCHGLPGILLTRLLASETWPDDRELKRRNSTLISDLRSSVLDGNSATSEMSLCHGFCGNAEVLRLAGGAGDDELTALYRSRGAHLGTDYGAWPHGLQLGQNLSLFTGLAGIGLSYLRLATAADESVLRPW